MKNLSLFFVLLCMVTTQFQQALAYQIIMGEEVSVYTPEYDHSYRGKVLSVKPGYISVLVNTAPGRTKVMDVELDHVIEYTNAQRFERSLPTTHSSADSAYEFTGGQLDGGGLGDGEELTVAGKRVRVLGKRENGLIAVIHTTAGFLSTSEAFDVNPINFEEVQRAMLAGQSMSDVRSARSDSYPVVRGQKVTVDGVKGEVTVVGKMPNGLISVLETTPAFGKKITRSRAFSVNPINIQEYRQWKAGGVAPCMIHELR